MIQPEENFRTWICLVTSSVETPTEFQVFLPDITRFCASIAQLGSLPEAIKQYTAEFVGSIVFEAPHKFLSSHASDESRHVISDFFKIIIGLAYSGLSQQPRSSTYPTAVFNILTVDNSRLYQHHSGMLPMLREYACDCGFFSLASKGVKNGLESADLLSFCYPVCVCCLQIANNPMNFWELTVAMLRQLLRFAKSDLRGITIQVINRLFSGSSLIFYERHLPVDPSFVSGWLDIFAVFLKSDMFEKQLCGYKAIQTLTEHSLLSGFVAEYFTEVKNLQILSGSNLHTHLLPYFTTILKFLATSNLLGACFLADLWRLHAVQHASELAGFFEIFVQIGMSLSQELIPGFVQMCLTPEVPSETWVVFIRNLGSEMGRRPECRESFDRIVDMLFPLAREEGPLQSVCLDALSHLLRYDISGETTLLDLIERVRGERLDVVFFKVLLNPVHVQQLSNRSHVVAIIAEAVDFLVQAKDSNDREPVYQFLHNICDTNRIEIPESQLPALFEFYPRCRLFRSFPKDMIAIGAISTNYLTSFIQTFPPESVTSDFYILVHDFIYKINGLQSQSLLVSHLPLEQEFVLWEMAVRPSPEQFAFADMLAELYSCNDGTRLTDSEMITIFLSNWQNYNKNPEADKRCLLILLEIFVTKIENDVDISFFGIQRRNPAYEGNQLTVHVRGRDPLQYSNQHLSLPELMFVNALKFRIGKLWLLKPDHFQLYSGGAFLRG